MERIPVWDLPVRLFHWLLAGCFVAAFGIAQLVDDDSAAFAVHMLLGGVMAFTVVLRLVWGLVGSRHARLKAFAYGPAAVVAYVRGALAGEDERHVGHNPGAGVAIFLIFALVLGLATTGALMGQVGEAFEEVHEVLAYALLTVVGLHVAGVVWHLVRHRENIVRSMIDGAKLGDPADAIPSAHPAVAVVFLLLTGLWGWGLVSGYDRAGSQVRLPLVGVTLALGEGEHEHGHGHEGRWRGEHDDGDDD